MDFSSYAELIINSKGTTIGLAFLVLFMLLVIDKNNLNIVIFAKYAYLY